MFSELNIRAVLKCSKSYNFYLQMIYLAVHIMCVVYHQRGKCLFELSCEPSLHASYRSVEPFLASEQELR